MLCTESSIFKSLSRTGDVVHRECLLCTLSILGPSLTSAAPQSTLQQSVAHLSQRVKRIQVVDYTMVT